MPAFIAHGSASGWAGGHLQPSDPLVRTCVRTLQVPRARVRVQHVLARGSSHTCGAEKVMPTGRDTVGYAGAAIAARVTAGPGRGAVTAVVSSAARERVRSLPCPGPCARGALRPAARGAPPTRPTLAAGAPCQPQPQAGHMQGPMAKKCWHGFFRLGPQLCRTGPVCPPGPGRCRPLRLASSYCSPLSASRLFAGPEDALSARVHGVTVCCDRWLRALVRGHGRQSCAPLRGDCKSEAA